MRYLRWIFWPLSLALLPSMVAAHTIDMFRWQHSEEIARSGPDTTDYLLGLGALQKIGGRWRHKEFETVRGELNRATWQVQGSFTSQEAYAWALEQLPEEARQLYSCQGLSCGSSAQWADRVFQQRLLYGHDQRQQYSVWTWLDGERNWYAVIYAVDRANRRHYLHVDLVEVSSPD